MASFKALTVVLDADLGEEGIQRLADAIGCLKHVIEVKPTPVAHSDWIERERVRRELGQQILAVLYPKEGKG